MRPDWPLIATRLRQRGVDVVVITNGIRIDDATLATLREVGVSGISVSIDGSRPGHDAIRIGAPRGTGSVYDRAFGAIERGKRAGLKVAVITRVHRGNLRELEATLARLVDRRQVSITVADDIGYFGRFEPKLRGARGGEPRSPPRAAARPRRSAGSSSGLSSAASF